MPSYWRAEPARRLLGGLPAAATAIAEGCWVFVVYAAIQLGPPGHRLLVDAWLFVVAAGCGIVVSRLARGSGSWAPRWATVLLAGISGWLLDPAARTLLTTGPTLIALQTHATGFVLGLAAWRGTRHGEPRDDDVVVASLLTWVVPGLTMPWLLGMAGVGREAFVAAAFPATLLFVAGGLIATGVTRLEALSRLVGLDWRRNRLWLLLLIGVVLLVIVLGLPFALILGVSIGALAGIVAGPIASVLGAVVSLAAGIARGIDHVLPGAPIEPPGIPMPMLPAFPGWLGNVISLALGLMLAVMLVVIGRRVRGTRIAKRPDRSPEERHLVWPSIGLGFSVPHLPRFSFGRRGTPATAAGAYLALLRDLEPDDTRARRPTESPAAHARRLRHERAGGLALDLLAADFELERYATWTLPAAEVRRAIRRWRVARDRRR
jgi:hypothetical protein